MGVILGKRAKHSIEPSAVFTRVQQILTPEQLKAFQEFQTSQRELQMAGMKMAAKMFAPKGQ